MNTLSKTASILRNIKQKMQDMEQAEEDAADEEILDQDAPSEAIKPYSFEEKPSFDLPQADLSKIEESNENPPAEEDEFEEAAAEDSKTAQNIADDDSALTEDDDLNSEDLLEEEFEEQYEEEDNYDEEDEEPLDESNSLKAETDSQEAAADLLESEDDELEEPAASEDLDDFEDYEEFEEDDDLPEIQNIQNETPNADQAQPAPVTQSKQPLDDHQFWLAEMEELVESQKANLPQYYSNYSYPNYSGNIGSMKNTPQLRSNLNSEIRISDSALNKSQTSIEKLQQVKQVVDSAHSLADIDFEAIAVKLMNAKLEKWFNDNLPELVEKIVREQIKKIVS